MQIDHNIVTDAIKYTQEIMPILRVAKEFEGFTAQEIKIGVVMFLATITAVANNGVKTMDVWGGTLADALAQSGILGVDPKRPCQVCKIAATLLCG